MDTLGPQAVGAMLTALVAIPFADPASATGSSLVIAICFNLIGLPLALALILRGPASCGARGGLILLLETILGPTWVWIALGERPALQTALAGILILVTLAVHARRRGARGNGCGAGRARRGIGSGRDLVERAGLCSAIAASASSPAAAAIRPIGSGVAMSNGRSVPSTTRSRPTRSIRYASACGSWVIMSKQSRPR